MSVNSSGKSHPPTHKGSGYGGKNQFFGEPLIDIAFFSNVAAWHILRSRPFGRYCFCGFTWILLGLAIEDPFATLIR